METSNMFNAFELSDRQVATLVIIAGFWLGTTLVALFCKKVTPNTCWCAVVSAILTASFLCWLTAYILAPMLGAFAAMRGVR